MAESSLASTDQAVGAADLDATAIDESNIIVLIRNLLPNASDTGRIIEAPDRGIDATEACARESARVDGKEQAGSLLWDLSVIGAVAAIMVNAGMILPVLEAVVGSQLLQLVDEDTPCSPPRGAHESKEGGSGNGQGREQGAPKTTTSCKRQLERAPSASPPPPQPKACDEHTAATSEAAANRRLEVALGILGNLASHPELSDAIVGAGGGSLLDMLTGPVLHGVGAEHALSEFCRLASTALRRPVSQ
jgi:hypothetical protein